MPIAARRDLVAKLTSDLELIERMTTQADWFSFRLRGATRKR